MDPFRILLVDPVDDDRELQAIVLRKAGFIVLESDNPYKTAATARPDAIVIEVTPARLGAVEFIGRLQADRRTADIPIVAVSTYPRLEIPPTDGFVGKTEGPEALLREVARVLPASSDTQ
jgi:CheY-like chemotaxis protein